MNTLIESFDWEAWEKTLGWLTRKEAEYLLDHSANAKVLEIGAYHGRSTRVFTHLAKYVLSIDPFISGGKEDVQALFDNAVCPTRLIPKTSDEAFDLLFNVVPYAEADKFDVVFIDGDHSYHQVMRDIKNYSQLLKQGGLLIIHDYFPYFHKGSAWTSIEIQEACNTMLEKQAGSQCESMVILQEPFIFKSSDLFSLPIPPKQPKILLIGDRSNPVDDYYEILTKMGYYVFWVGDNALHFNTINFKRNVEINQCSLAYAGEAVVYTKRFSLAALLSQIGTDFDLILQFQGWFYPNDMEKSPIPYIYYNSEGWWPEIPKVAWKVAVPNQTTKDLVIAQNPHIKNADISIIPFSIGGVFNARNFVLPQKRDKLVSYAGSLYRFTLLYQERRDLLFKLLIDPDLQDLTFFHWEDGKPWNYEGPHFKCGKGALGAVDYTQLLDESEYGLNIPTRLGANFRDLEVPACGAILITKKNQDLVDMGFVHSQNCYFYQTYDELKRILEIPYSPAIAMMGYTLVNLKHRHIHRIPQFESLFAQLTGMEVMGIRTDMYKLNESITGQEDPVQWLLDRPLP